MGSKSQINQRQASALASSEAVPEIALPENDETTFNKI